MKKISILTASILFCSYGAFSKTAREEIKGDIQKSASVFVVYPTPQKPLTPSPKGKKAFYISHYGRHGSRYHTDKKYYTLPLHILDEANEANCLTQKGIQLHKNVRQMYNESLKRYGELTELGAEQHHQIARRMYERFPDVFKEGCSIDAKSSVFIRCILSMENELQELSALNPKLKIKHDASEHDRYYLMYFPESDSVLSSVRHNAMVKNYFSNWDEENIHPNRFIQSIFTNSAWVMEHLNKKEFYLAIFDLARIVQNSEIRHTIRLYDLFTENEVYTLWQRCNMRSFVRFGTCVENGGEQPFVQRYLLRKMVEEADSCIKLTYPNASLRFGHESVTVPLMCLLNLNGCGDALNLSNYEEKGWVDYRLSPMACNVQFIFYRSNPKDKDVWVKVLLNEEEATLPITPVSGPYYRWEEVRKYCLEKINAYKEGKGK